MKSEVRVAAVQMDVAWLDPEANLAKMQRLVAEAASDGGAELVVFPELVSSGFLTPRDREFMRRYYAAAQKVPGPFTDGLAAAARKHRVYVVAGVLEAHPLITGTFYNSAVLVSPEGKLLGVHHKVHIPSEEKHYFYPGTDLDVYETDLGRVAMSICADNSFPEMARVYALKGAEVLTVPYSRSRMSNPTLYHGIVTCRAYENQNYVVSANRVGREGDLVFEGRSCIASPTGEVLARSDGEEETILRAVLDAETLIATRAWQTRFRDRRPELYGDITRPF